MEITTDVYRGIWCDMPLPVIIVVMSMWGELWEGDRLLQVVAWATRKGPGVCPTDDIWIYTSPRGSRVSIIGFHIKATVTLTGCSTCGVLNIRFDNNVKRTKTFSSLLTFRIYTTFVLNLLLFFDPPFYLFFLLSLTAYYFANGGRLSN